MTACATSEDSGSASTPGTANVSVSVISTTPVTEAPRPSDSEEPRESTMSSSGPSTPKETMVLVDFSVEGGYANLARSVAISETGAYEVERSGHRSSGTMSQAELDALVAELDESALFDRDREYPPPAGAADLQRYEIRYNGVTVVAYDTTVPPELTRAVSSLDRLTTSG